MWRKRFIALVLLLAGLGVGYFVHASEYDPKGIFGKFPFKYGLDIQGGTELIYQADVSKIATGEVRQTMDALRDVIERRVNLFGVSEPVVQVEEANTLSGKRDQRLIVELPGVTDIAKAVKLIGQTPLLEFKTARPDGEEKTQILAAYARVEEAMKNSSSTLTEAQKAQLVAMEPLLNEDPHFIPTQLTGAYLKKATLQFSQTSQPTVSLAFTDEGRELFAQITKENIGKTVAIYLDGSPISTPTVREAILDGNAEISGSFNVQEAKELVGRLNSGALPVPITLLSTQTLGATLGEEALASGVRAGILGILLVAIFLIFWYRLPGIIATIALSIYITLMLAIFKLVPVTLTAAGIAGFILSIGMAVDANILIFERMKEELLKGKDIADAMHDGFARAWLSIRDSNISSMISAVILFWFGTSLVKGFALTLGLGVLISMFSAITVSRMFLYALGTHGRSKLIRFIFGNGLR